MSRGQSGVSQGGSAASAPPDVAQGMVCFIHAEGTLVAFAFLLF